MDRADASSSIQQITQSRSTRRASGLFSHYICTIELHFAVVFRLFTGERQRGQTRILGQSEEKVHVVRLAPGHHLLSRKAAVSPYENANTRPALADVGNDACHLLYGTVRRVEARHTQLGSQQMPSAEHVQRQVAITVVIAVIEPPLLLPMNRIIGGIKIEDNLTWWPLVSFQKKIDEKTSNRHRIVTDLAVARRLQLAQLQTIER